jgi:hypothetical protein
MRFGLVNELLDPGAPVDLAVHLVAELAEPSELLLELAAAGRNDPTSELVEKLAESEGRLFDVWKRYLDEAGFIVNRPDSAEVSASRSS